MVVQCDISSEAARQQAFNKLLADNQITWEESPAPSQSTVAPAKPSRAAGGTELAKTGTGGLAKTGAGTLTLSASGPEASEPGGVELVYAEATSDRVEATLAQLAAQPEQFPAVSVEPAPGVPSQQSFSNYSRRGVATQNAPAGSNQFAMTTNGGSTTSLGSIAHGLDKGAINPNERQLPQAGSAGEKGQPLSGGVSAAAGALKQVPNLADNDQKMAPMAQNRARRVAVFNGNQNAAQNAVPQLDNLASSSAVRETLGFQQPAAHTDGSQLQSQSTVLADQASKPAASRQAAKKMATVAGNLAEPAKAPKDEQAPPPVAAANVVSALRPQAGPPVAPAQSAQSQSVCRVLFVLRVVGPENAATPAEPAPAAKEK
jgi:hypothetical protein